MKKFTLLLLAITIIGSYTITAQVSINTDGSNPDGSAILDLKSTTQGFLLPRMNTIQIKNISNPVAGLQVFNTDSSDFYGFNGSVWISMWNSSDTITTNWTCGDPIIDSRDGISYLTVQIGTQCWMAENLNIGIMIDLVNNQTDNDTIEKYCYDSNESNCDTYGGLYQWDEMMQYVTTAGTQGICPTGWHLPTDDEWKTMEMALGMSQSEADKDGWRGTDEGEKIKSISGWYNNGNGTNSSGFNGLPGGRRQDNGTAYYYLGDYGIWWTTTEGTFWWSRQLGYSINEINRLYYTKEYGLSVRCLHD